MKITMDGKYAYSHDPHTEVRILCVDRPAHVNHPVCSMDPVTGFIRCHAKDGSYDSPSFDLVPLQEKLPDLWVNVYDGGEVSAFQSKSVAQNCLAVNLRGRTVKFPLKE